MTGTIEMVYSAMKRMKADPLRPFGGLWVNDHVRYVGGNSELKGVEGKVVGVDRQKDYEHIYWVADNPAWRPSTLNRGHSLPKDPPEADYWTSDPAELERLADERDFREYLISWA